VRLPNTPTYGCANYNAADGDFLLLVLVLPLGLGGPFSGLVQGALRDEHGQDLLDNLAEDKQEDVCSGSVRITHLLLGVFTTNHRRHCLSDCHKSMGMSRNVA
jgi:hypothetical protein